MRKVCLFAVVLFGLISGCDSGGPRLVDVSGTVTLDGKPVPNAIVVFNPDFPGGSNSLGRTNSDGKYKLEYSQDSQGALVGKHIVEITTKKVAASDLPDDGSVVSKEFVAIPTKYKKRGSLSAEVLDQSNVIDFQLDSH